MPDIEDSEGGQFFQKVINWFVNFIYYILLIRSEAPKKDETNKEEKK